MAAVANGQVIIFKAPSDSEKEHKDAYFEILSSNGFEVINVPVLDFEFVNLDKLLIKLKTPADYSGIIFSSPRCVKGCILSANGELSVLESWKNHKNFVVGEATCKNAEELGLSVEGKEAGNANALSEIMAKCKEIIFIHDFGQYGKPFLYPIGSLTNNNFKSKLEESGIEVDDIVVYKTKPHPNLKSNIASLMNRIRQPVYFLYFSPSGLNFTLPIMKELNFDVKCVKFVAIGPTTENAMKESGITVYKTVTKPTPQATLEAFTS